MSPKHGSSTKKYRDAKLPCQERARLEAAYQEALRRGDELEASLSEETVSSKGSKVREAKRRSEEALRRAIHILDELRAHERKHECVGRSLADPVPRLNED